MKNKTKKALSFDYRYGFSMPSQPVTKTKKGLSQKIVTEISKHKKEPLWMKNIRLESLALFEKKPMPSWGADLSEINFKNITYFLRATKSQKQRWEELPQEIKETYDRIGVPEAEKKFLSGVSAQYESEVVYEQMNKELKKKGVIFCNMDTAVKKHASIVKKYFGKLIPANDNKFSALNTAVWSGGSFVYIPKNTRVDLPLQAYFRINSERFGQFERTLIIAEEGSYVHYTEGCTAPTYSTNSLHAAVVEIFVKKDARVRYTTVQNWSNNIYNLVTKRARAEENATMEWVDCNIGSKKTMKYPAIHLAGKNAHGEMLSIALAGKGQHQDAGAKMIHLAPETTSRVISKSIAKDGGRTSYRGLIHIAPNAKNAKSHVICDALLVDKESQSDTYPTMKVHAKNAQIEHEATTQKIDEEKLHYLTTRGLEEEQAKGLIVNGFIEPVAKEIPFEYAIELNRLINLEMEGSIG
ncbi:MAG: Fe-S cluster assembly protein SufB [Candidatus Moranbacteria bacterium]|nr:Fe-S cluster assembly protein SufB [Candidatus Moranbacteria bacterium]